MRQVENILMFFACFLFIGPNPAGEGLFALWLNSHESYACQFLGLEFTNNNKYLHNLYIGLTPGLNCLFNIETVKGMRN